MYFDINYFYIFVSSSKRERMKKMYHFFINPFISNSQTNFKKMFALALDHTIVLKTASDDAVIMNLYNRTMPVFENYSTIYGNSISLRGVSIGSVTAYNQMYKTIPKKIRQWEVKILNFIEEGSPEYVMLFPSGKRHLYKGTQEQMKSKLQAFETQLGKRPDMQAIYEEVKAFNVEFRKILSGKGEKTTNSTMISSELRLSHNEMGLMLYRNLLSLCEHYAPDTHKVEVFFKMQLLRKHKKKIVED